MDESFEYQGKWWLPETPGEIVHGQLSFTPGEGFKLNLQGLLRKVSENKLVVPEDFIQPPIILGVTANNKKVTLCKCLQTGSTGHHRRSDETHTSTYFAPTAFLDVHFASEREIDFEQIQIRYSNLEEWARKNPFRRDSSDDDRKRVTVRYELPNPIEAEVQDYKIGIYFFGPIESFSSGSESIKIGHEIWIVIRASTSRSFDNYLTQIRNIQNFLTLAMNTPTFPLSVRGVTEINKEFYEDGFEYKPPVSIFYPVSHWPGEITKQHWFEMLFDLPAIENNFETLVRNWMTKLDTLKPVIDLYFSVLYNPHGYLELRFLSIVQAIETYHRRVVGGKYLGDEQYLAGLYKKFVDVIPKDLESDFSESLKSGKLRYANEYSLRRRLRETIKRLENELNFDFVQNRMARESFVSKVVDTRNYLTHYSTELVNSTANSSEETFVLVNKLQLVLEVCLLKELGFDSDQIQEMIPRSQRYRFLKSRDN